MFVLLICSIANEIMVLRSPYLEIFKRKRSSFWLDCAISLYILVNIALTVYSGCLVLCVWRLTNGVLLFCCGFGWWGLCIMYV